MAALEIVAGVATAALALGAHFALYERRLLAIRQSAWADHWNERIDGRG